MRLIPAAAKRNAVLWLSQGISCRRLALTLALGFAIGCIPVIGIPTVLCAGLALALRLNLPAIQVANYLAMPLQLALIVPFVRLGGRITTRLASPESSQVAIPGALQHFSALHFAAHMSGMAGEALLAWLVAAVPAVLLMTLALNLMLRRIPVLRNAEAGD
ncbi:MAG TPA: DUF2062 domain-containing protein [Terracidiphilus sp.]|jgi:uncharacterized protein (DUF2062 family)